MFLWLLHGGWLQRTAGWYRMCPLSFASHKKCQTQWPHQKLRSAAKMAVKAFERSPPKTAPWAILHTQAAFRWDFNSTWGVFVCPSSCVYVHLPTTNLYALSHTYNSHVNSCQEHCHYVSAESQMASASHTLERSTWGAGLTWRSSLGLALL